MTRSLIILTLVLMLTGITEAHDACQDSGRYYVEQPQPDWEAMERRQRAERNRMRQEQLYRDSEREWDNMLQMNELRDLRR